MSHPTYSLEDLAERSDTPARTIRYYIQRGLVSRPVGEKRGAHYTAEHLQQLLQIRKWVGAGLSLQRIGELMQGEAAGRAMSPEAMAAQAFADRRAAPAPAPAPLAASRQATTLVDGRYPETTERINGFEEAGHAMPSPGKRNANVDADAGSAADANANANASKYPLTLKHHHAVAPGIDLVIDPARSPLMPDQAEALLALIREHLNHL